MNTTHELAVEIEISTLHPHPKQAEQFLDLPEATLGDLARDIEINGLQQPIDILPCGTILSGHQRVKACRQLGHSQIRANVHYELEGDEHAAERFFIEANLNRRHMSKLGLARAYKQLKALEANGRLSTRDRGDLRDEIGEKLGFSGRTLDRYLRVLKAPRLVQQAVERDELPLTYALRAVDLPRQDREELVGRLEAGENPRKVVADYIEKPSAKKVCPVTAALGQLQQAHRALGALPDSAWDSERLEDLETVLGALQAWGQELQETSFPMECGE